LVQLLDPVAEYWGDNWYETETFTWTMSVMDITCSTLDTPALQSQSQSHSSRHFNFRDLPAHNYS
jgi:hypothetical protein